MATTQTNYQRRKNMRKLIVAEFITLDGVIQAPGGPDEDTEGGFAHGGWTWPYWPADSLIATKLCRPTTGCSGRSAATGCWAAHAWVPTSADFLGILPTDPPSEGDKS